MKKKFKKGENTMKTLLKTTLIILILFVVVPFSHAVYVVSQLTNDTYDDLKPQINNIGEVVYEKHLVVDSEIYKIIDKEEYNISISSGGFDYNPQINSSGDVLYESDVNGYHFITLQHSDWFPMSISPTDPDTPSQLLPLQYWGETYPQFNDNNQVVWRTFTEMNKDDIWLYDSAFNNASAFNKLTMACGGTGYPVLGQKDKNPQINANGDVVWQRGVNDNCDPLQQAYYYDIFLYDGNTSENISKNMDVNDEYPQINDAGIVVWESGGQIYSYSEGVSEKISNNPGYTNSAPQIINQCGLVVWQGCNNSDCEIFLYKYGFGAINISNDPGHHDEFPQINERGQVVWVKDYSCGSGLCSYEQGIKGLEVMLYDPFEKTLTNISNRNGDDEDPQINDRGEVVWSGYHQGNWEIFKAAPKIDLTAVDDGWQLGVVYTIFDLCESISDIFWSSQEAQIVEKVEFKKEMSQASAKVKVTRKPPGPGLGDSPELGEGDLMQVQYNEPIFGFIDLEVTVEQYWGSPTKITVKNISPYTLSSSKIIIMDVFITDGNTCWEWNPSIEIPSSGNFVEKDVPAHSIGEVNGWEVRLDHAETYIDSNRDNNTQKWGINCGGGLCYYP
jgi:hypothetical protein